MAASPLVYPYGDFIPFTKILSSEVNGKFTAISTLLNTTKLSDTNLQDNGISWGKLTLQTASNVAVTNSSGQLTVSTVLASALGGTGFAFTATTLNANLAVQSNTTGSALTLSAVIPPPTEKVYMALNYT